MPRGGNSTKKLYDKARHDRLVKAEGSGVSRRAVAALGGIAERTYLRWLERGKMAAEAQDEGEDCLATDAQYADLWRETEQARALWEQEQLEAMDDPDEKQWQKHAWKLERRLPSEYALVQTTRHEGQAPAVQLNIIGNPEALAASREMLRHLAAPDEVLELEAGDDG